jgi:hypothetical protein
MLAADTREAAVRRGVAAMPGAWDESEIAAYLAAARIPLRLSAIDAAGFPRVLSLWFLPDDGALWCATQASAQVVRFLAAEPRCGFEVAGDTPPYRGVRGTGRATIDPRRGAQMLERLLARYGVAPDSRLARTLTARAASEVAIRIDPLRVTSWDFSQRMAGAIAAR